MGDIQYRIESLGEHFKEMQVTEVDGTNVIYVVVSFPPKWIVDDEVQKKYDVSVMNGKEPGDYYFCADISTGFDAVFDAIDHCIGVNKDAMERAQIFQEKIAELKEIFGNGTNSIARLKTLEFVFPPQKKSYTRKTPAEKPYTRKPPVEKSVVKETENEEQC